MIDKSWEIFSIDNLQKEGLYGPSKCSFYGKSKENIYKPPYSIMSFQKTFGANGGGK